MLGSYKTIYIYIYIEREREREREGQPIKEVTNYDIVGGKVKD